MYMNNHENDPGAKLTLSPEATAVVDGVFVALDALQVQLEGIHQLDVSQLAEVYAGLRVLRARWTMPPYDRAYDTETVPRIINSTTTKVSLRHTSGFLRANNALGMVGVEVEGQEKFVDRAEQIRETLAHNYANQELSSEEIDSADPGYHRLIEAILGK